ncbi:MAG: hypothetical protein ACREE6_12900, partial [Limisphaerales bacterium]
WGSAQGANYYSPLLTTDSTGTVGSSYFYNPRMVNAYAAHTLRRYQTVSQMEPHRLFAIDYVGPVSSGGPDGSQGPAGMNPNTIPHARDHGWNVLFTDGSVQFARITEDNNYYFNLILRNLVLSESEQSYIGFDQFFNLLEQDH